MNGYKFLALDDPTRLAELLSKRVHGEPLSDADEKGSERVQIQSQKGSKGFILRLKRVQKGFKTTLPL
jgi:hypothetical protein